MHFRLKIYICVSFLALLGVSGCYTPPTPKPLTTVKPPESTMPAAKLRKKRNLILQANWIIILCETGGISLFIIAPHRPVVPPNLTDITEEKRDGRMDWDIIL